LHCNLQKSSHMCMRTMRLIVNVETLSVKASQVFHQNSLMMNPGILTQCSLQNSPKNV